MSGQSDHNSQPLKPSTATVSPPTHPSSESTTSHQSQTPTLHNEVTPKLKPPSFHDCWSEEATFTLIEAWGERIVKLNSGSLRQNHWQEVADAVNDRHGHVKKARRSSVQCKNRIDTLKKKYKVEKALGSDGYVSAWPFFKPLHSLLGSAFKPSAKTPTPPVPRKRTATVLPAVRKLPPPPSSVPVGRRSKRPPPPPFQPPSDSSFFRRNFSVMAAAAAAVDGADGGSDTSLSSGGNWNRNRDLNRNRNLYGNKNGNGSQRLPAAEDGEVSSDPYHELAEAIGRFADVYKRVEEVKQRQVVELEKQRMQFTKDLELERMKLLMESQVQLRKLKRSKSNLDADLCKSDDSASIS